MSLLFQVVFSSACRNTHHRLALDALRHLRGADAERWTDLFLHHYRTYLAGSKAPDEQFKDFQNHVLHVADGGWGGAIAAARRWYGRTVDALRRQSWSEAVNSAGVLSHYFSDPFMPLHTGQTEREAKVHRALEWSVAKSYGELQQILDFDLGGYPRVEAPRSGDWLSQMITLGAELGHEHYEAVIDHYDLAKGVKNPPAGMDQECKDRIARCLGHAVVGFARVLERAFAEAAVEPPHVEITLQGFLATLAVPIRYVLNQIHDLHERMVVEAIYDEVQRTGKVLQNLPDDDRTIRQLHAEEVLNKPLVELDAIPPEPTGTKHGQGQAERFQINRLITSPVIDSGRGSASLLRVKPRGVIGSRGSEIGSRRSEVGRREGEAPAEPRKMNTPARSVSEGIPRQRLPSSQLKRDPLPRRFDVQSPVIKPSAEIPNPQSPISVPNPPESELPPAAPALRSPEPVSPPKSEIKNLKSEIDAPATIPLRFRLNPQSPVVDAPSIGSKTAGRLERAGVITVADLLAANPEALATKLNQKHITPQTIRTWQAEATLACRLPEVHGHDAQILVASGVTDPEEIVGLTPAELLELVTPWVKSADGQRVLRSSKPPDLAEVSDWIAWARQARQLKAA